MNFPNRTPIHVGMAGDFFGKHYRVAGRIVLGENEGGQTYYWTEFNLVDDKGESADLAFEETESRAEWRLFVLFEPEYPITAEDARSKRVGNQLNLDGTDVVINFVSRSRIYHIEGQGAEGEDVGDIADYFNAQGGATRIVVSWTGEEVECYRGMDVSFKSVRNAFQLDPTIAENFTTSLIRQKQRSSLFKGGMILIWVILATALGVIAYDIFKPKRFSNPLAFMQAPIPPASLKPGATVSVKGTPWQIRRHVLVEIAQIGLRFERHEYELQDQSGNTALLIYGYTPGAKDWYLFTPAAPLAPLTPQTAAAKKLGETIDVDGGSAPVTSLFKTILRRTDSAETERPSDGSVLYGFTARAANVLLLARWNERRLAICRGTALVTREVAISSRSGS
jgi:hypothetical protein